MHIKKIKMMRIYRKQLSLCSRISVSFETSKPVCYYRK